MNELSIFESFVKACGLANASIHFSDEWRVLREKQKELWRKLSPNERMQISEKVFTLESKFPARI